MNPESYDQEKLVGLFEDLKALDVEPDYSRTEENTESCLNKWAIVYEKVSFQKNSDEYCCQDLGYPRINKFNDNGDAFKAVIEYKRSGRTKEIRDVLMTDIEFHNSWSKGKMTHYTYHDFNYSSCIPSELRPTKRKASSRNSKTTGAKGAGLLTNPIIEAS